MWRRHSLNAPEEVLEAIPPLPLGGSSHTSIAHTPVRFIIAALSYLADTSIPLRLAVLQEAYHQVLALSGQAEEDLSDAELQELRDFGRAKGSTSRRIINSRYGSSSPGVKAPISSSSSICSIAGSKEEAEYLDLPPVLAR